MIGKLLIVSGLVLSVGSVYPSATQLVARCSSCGHELRRDCGRGEGFDLPKRCQRQEGGIGVGGKCPADPYVVLTDLCRFEDAQRLKIQEHQSDVPSGEMPRHLSAQSQGCLVNRSVPGSRAIFCGVLAVEAGHAVSSIRHTVLRILGVATQEEADATDAKRDLQPRTRDEVVQFIAPEIYGMHDVKIAIACQLFGGVTKQLPDGHRTRGDINVLLFGDPSVAKSQLLKFAQRLSPIGVYTSGKGSSGAGLTAAVVRAKRGGFLLEGGAMVLADGGLVCIDEFDKMRDEDRVAIHEAMEQQTISIAKAGISALLNTRCAVLAAANPTLGRLDATWTARDNIDFQATILSRFDLIFVLRDVRDMERDKQVVAHVVDLHKGTEHANPTNKEDQRLIRDYIKHARLQCRPVMSEAVAEALQSRYVEMRQKAVGGAVPMTVRQLEAMIRISESLARMELKSEAGPEHVAEALRLFNASTGEAASAGIGVPNEKLLRDEEAEFDRIRDYLERRIVVGHPIAQKLVKEELVKQGHHEDIIEHTLLWSLRSGKLQSVRGNRFYARVASTD